MHKAEQNLQSTQHDSYTLEARSELITTASEHNCPSEDVKRRALLSCWSYPLLFSTSRPGLGVSGPWSTDY